LSSNAPDSLETVLGQHGIELAQTQVEQLDRYCQLVWEWNSKINLTRHTDYERFVARDLVDTLAIARHLQQGEKVLDVGSGGGVPGVVLAIIRPDLAVTVSDSVGKKAMVLADIVGKLGLKVPVHHGRAEDLLGRPRFDALTIRAVARLAKLLGWFKPHWSKFGRLLVLKGPSWVEERGEARHLGLMHGLALRKLCSYPLPGTESESVLLLLCPADRLPEHDEQESAG